MPDNTLSRLQDIRVKVRRLTRSPSTVQLSDAVLDQYVNNFILYDLSEHVDLSSLKTSFAFFTSPGVDAYTTVAAPATSPFFNFKNLYMFVEPPVYIAGYQARYSQSQEQFYNLFPKVSSIVTLTQGDGVTTNYVGTLSSVPLLRNSVTFTSIDAAGNALVLSDNGSGNLLIPNNVATIPPSTIDYETGAYVLNFSAAPALSVDVVAQTVPIVLSRPNSVLFFGDVFYVRPVPDQAYKIEIQVSRRPTELLNANDLPDISAWWQYIAYGAAKKIFEDRMDMESVNAIMPEFKTQETLILRKTIKQMSSERTPTIYSEGIGDNFDGSGWLS